MVIRDTNNEKIALEEVENKWRYLANFIIDLKKRNIEVPERIVTAFTCCKSLINHCKYHLDGKDNPVEYYKILSHLSREILDIESSLIIIAADKVGEDYALMWTNKLNERTLKT